MCKEESIKSCHWRREEKTVPRIRAEKCQKSFKGLEIYQTKILEKFNLYLLEWRRLRADLIQVYH